MQRYNIIYDFRFTILDFLIGLLRWELERISFELPLNRQSINTSQKPPLSEPTRRKYLPRITLMLLPTAV